LPSAAADTMLYASRSDTQHDCAALTDTSSQTAGGVHACASVVGMLTPLHVSTAEIGPTGEQVTLPLSYSSHLTAQPPHLSTMLLVAWFGPAGGPGGTVLSHPSTQMVWMHSSAQQRAVPAGRHYQPMLMATGHIILPWIRKSRTQLHSLPELSHNKFVDDEET
jgi:hypothetical protein